jgi:hypothetical protein
MTRMTWIALPLLALSAQPARAHAQGDGANAELGSTLIAGRAARPLYKSHPGPELEDWIDPSTGTSTRTATGCGGLLVEAALFGDRSRNYVALTMINTAAVPMSFARVVTSARFGNGAYRRLDETSQVALEPGMTFEAGRAFDDKQVFEDQRTIELAIRVIEPGAQTGCTIAILFERFADDQARASYIAYDTLELTFGAGMRLAEGGGQAELNGGSRVSAQMSFAGFLSLHHGISATLLFDLFGSGAVDDITTREIGPDPGVSTTGFLVGYVGRIYLAPWLTAAYEPSIGPYVFVVARKSDGDDGTALSTPVIALRQRLRFAAQAAPFGVAASLGHLVIPYGELGAVELSGQTLTAMLELMITN